MSNSGEESQLSYADDPYRFALNPTTHNQVIESVETSGLSTFQPVQGIRY
jgi:hypothetical protein